MHGEIREFREQNTRVLNTMREDLTDLRSSVDDGFARVDEQFAHVDDGFAGMRGKLDGTAAGLQQIVGLLTTLIAQRGDE
jgi:hypothetical protein